MDDSAKQKSLQRYKRMATGLFLFMVLLYIAISIWMHRAPADWMGYVQAFAEAAMVGALADWFAVTALFHHPLGIRIPHTNLIENSKHRIGDNLGNFVVQNFLQPTAIRPYIQKISLAEPAGQWLRQLKNRNSLVEEASKLLRGIIQNSDDVAMQQFISDKIKDVLQEVKFSFLAATGLQYALVREEHQKIISLLADKIKNYVIDHENMILEKVESESYFFIPKFIDRKLSSKITKGLYSYFDEIENDAQHRVRIEISKQLASLAEELASDPNREEQLKKWVSVFLHEEKVQQYAGDIWKSLKQTLLHELQAPDSALRIYFHKQIEVLGHQLQSDSLLQTRINGWLRYNFYRYSLRHRNEVGTLIRNTVGNWKGKELSRKLELEVGKDLQFIRVNGTLVGGLMGLLIHTLTVVWS